MKFADGVVKKVLCCSVLTITMLVCASAARAQWLVDPSDTAARPIFDVPGTSSLDPDETLEYLDGLSTMTGDTLERLHANADVSWRDARMALFNHRAGRILRADSIARFTLRSRGSEAIDAAAQEGAVSGAYLGGPQAVYNKITATSQAIEVSALEQKQAWEPSFTDRLTGFAELKNPVAIAGSVSLEKAVAGDYALAFGNGLLFGGGLASATALYAASGIEERSFGLRGTVNGTAKDLRGAAIELTAGPSHLLLFASNRAFDATVKNDTIDTIYASRAHQTQSEVARENAASAQLFGARAEIATSDTAKLYFKGGATVSELRYNDPYVGTSTAPFKGNELGLAGADALAMVGAWTGIAEAALSSNDTSRQTAFLLSTIFEPASHVALSLQYRHIPYGFASPFGEIAGQSAASFSNLDGYYFGIELSPIPDRLRLNMYTELESELVPLGDLFGKQGHDYLVSASYKAAPSLEVKTTVRDQENATAASDSSRTGYVTLQGQTLNVRLDIVYRPEGNASFRTRFEHVNYALADSSEGYSEQGWLASEEIKVKIPTLKSELMFTTTRFQTASQPSSLWTYEEESPGTAAYDALEGLGWRIAIRGSVRPVSAFSCSAYLSGTVYDVPRAIGTGVTARTGTSDFTAMLQIDVRL